jgi:hypothetical protein
MNEYMGSIDAVTVEYDLIPGSFFFLSPAPRCCGTENLLGDPWSGTVCFWGGFSFGLGLGCWLLGFRGFGGATGLDGAGSEGFNTCACW